MPSLTGSASRQLLRILVFTAVFGLQEGFTQTNTESPFDTGTIESTTNPQAAQKVTDQASSRGEGLFIGPGDDLDITVYGAPDLSGHARVGSDGNISVPMIGDAQVAGLTSKEAEEIIENRLRQSNIVIDPQVSVYVKEYTNSGISVVGEVSKPGFYSVLGPHRLLDIIQAAGGPTERAANAVSITHRNERNAVTLPLTSDPAEMAQSNIDLRPGDTVVVPRAGIVYILGEVNKPGGYIMNATGGITVLRAIAAAGGPTRSASLGRAKMVRRTAKGLEESNVPLKDLLHGKGSDIPVQNDDIVYVPSSRLKAALNGGSLLTTAATVAIYRVPF